MATSYLTPGVYVEETPPGSRPIEGVGTSVAAFVGFAEMGPRNKPTLVTNWSQFVDKFGSFHDGYYLAHSVYGYFANGGQTAWVVNLAPSLAPQSAIPAARDGGAKPALEIYAIRQGLSTPGLSVDIAYGDGVAALPPGPEPAAPPAPAEGEKKDDKAPAAKPPAPPPARADAGRAPDPTSPFRLDVKRGAEVLESYEGATMDRESPKYVETLVNGVSQFIWLTPPAGKVAVQPAPRAGSYALNKPAPTSLQVTTGDFMGKVQDRSGIEGLESIEEVTMVIAPDLMSAYKKGIIGDDALVGLQKAMLAHCERMQDRVAILDAPPGLDPQDMLEWRNKTMIDSEYGTLYYPWIKVLDPLDPTGKRLLSIPPSGHMAGIWARTDSERGVHKAPANEVIRGAVDVASQVTDGEQGLLNPKGVNCIRTFGTRGIRVWGARTLSSDAAWKYINVRRLFNYVEESIRLGTQWAVFEPNDFSLWQKLKRDITNFLMGPYRDGALFGATPEQAFYVKCDSETNPPDVIDRGMVICEIGICPVKPAEFVIFRITQLPTGWAAGQ
jgi:phage tail sheath protein FI